MDRPMGQAGYSTEVEPVRTVSPWAGGFTLFAAFMMIMLGGFHAFTGLVAIFDDAFYESPREYFVDFDASSWGWFQLVAGTIVFFAGLGVMSGAPWARIVGVVLAMLSALANFAFIPYQPTWSILMIVLAIGVIWALVAHGREVAQSEDIPSPYR